MVGTVPSRYRDNLKLTKLIPELLEKVDDEIMGFTIAVELASLTEKNTEDCTGCNGKYIGNS
mgnify:CR=1 FL=1